MASQKLCLWLLMIPFLLVVSNDSAAEEQKNNFGVLVQDCEIALDVSKQLDIGKQVNDIENTRTIECFQYIDGYLDAANTMIGLVKEKETTHAFYCLSEKDYTNMQWIRMLVNFGQSNPEFWKYDKEMGMMAFIGYQLKCSHPQ